MKYYSPSTIQILEYQNQQEFCFSTEESQDFILACSVSHNCYCDTRESTLKKKKKTIIIIEKPQ